MTPKDEHEPQRPRAPGTPGRAEAGTQGRHAIGLAWSVPRKQRKAYKATARALVAALTDLHEAAKVAAVLPFRHWPLREDRGGDHAWTGYWALRLAAGVDPDETWSGLGRAIANLPKSQSRLLPRAEVLRPQPGLDLPYRAKGRIRRQPRWHWIEYAVSRPGGRAEYYQDQSRFSAPFLRSFHASGVVTRAMGFESVRLLRDEQDLPRWDVVHIIGIDPFRVPKVPWILWRRKPSLDALARKVGHKTAAEVIQSWDALRTKYQAPALQDRKYTWRA